MTGSFLNTLGTVSRRGQWRLRRVFRAHDLRGRLDLSDTGLVDFSTADLVTIGVYPRPPFGFASTASWLGYEPQPVLFASSADGSLIVATPGILEALFADGWSATVRPGLYDVRARITIGPETELIADDPVRIV